MSGTYSFHPMPPKISEKDVAKWRKTGDGLLGDKSSIFDKIVTVLFHMLYHFCVVFCHFFIICACFTNLIPIQTKIDKKKSMISNIIAQIMVWNLNLFFWYNAIEEIRTKLLFFSWHPTLGCVVVELKYKIPRGTL